MWLTRRIYWNDEMLGTRFFLVIVPLLLAGVWVALSDRSSTWGIAGRVLLALVALWWLSAAGSGVVIGRRKVHCFLFCRLRPPVALEGVVRFESRQRELHTRSGYPGPASGNCAVVYVVYADGAAEPIWPLNFGGPDYNPMAVRRVNRAVRQLAQQATHDGHGEIDTGPDMVEPDY